MLCMTEDWEGLLKILADVVLNVMLNIYLITMNKLRYVKEHHQTVMKKGSVKIVIVWKAKIRLTYLKRMCIVTRGGMKNVTENQNKLSEITDLVLLENKEDCKMLPNNT